MYHADADYYHQPECHWLLRMKNKCSHSTPVIVNDLAAESREVY